MKKRFTIALCLIATVALAAVPAINKLADVWKKTYKSDPLEPPVAVFSRALVESPSAAGNLQILDRQTNSLRDINASELPTFVGVAKATLTSAAAATAINVVPDTAVPAGKKCYVLNYYVTVNGATDWTTTSTVKLQDTNGTPVDFVTLTASTLDGNETHGPFSDSATLESALKLGTGGTAGKGLQVVGDANGAGSNLVFVVVYAIK